MEVCGIDPTEVDSRVIGVSNEDKKLFDNIGSVLISHSWRYLDQARFYKCAVESTLQFRRRREIGIAAMLKKARARGKNLVKRQAGLLQSDRSKKGNIQVPASPRIEPIRGVIQSFNGIERAELAPRVYWEFEFCLDSSCHYGLMISVMYDERWTSGKTV